MHNNNFLLNLVKKPHQRRKICFRIACIAAVFVLLTSAVITTITTYRYATDAITNSSEQITQMIQQLSINIEGYIEDITNVASYVYYNSDILSALETPSDGSPLSLLEQSRTVENYLNRVMLLSKNDIMNYYILTDNMIYHGGRMQRDIDYSCNYQEYSWYQRALKTNGNIFLPPHMEQLVLNPKYKVISIVKPFRNINHPEKVLGVIKVDLLYSAIEQSAEVIDVGQDGGLIIIDQENQIIYQNMTSDLIDTLSTSSTNQSSYTQKIGNETYLINTRRVDNTGWNIIVASSMNELMHSAINAIMLSIVLAALCALIAVVLVFITIHRYLKPLDDLVSVMKHVETGNLTMKAPVIRTDEISYVNKSFNTMITNLNQTMKEKEDLLKRVYTAEMLNTEAQLYALQSQIKPHFLYNTLNLFSIQIQMGMLEDAVSCIGKLELLLRSITKWKDSIPVKESFQILDAYLSIQSYRFGSRLSYVLDYMPELEDKQIIPFILQPLVENAVIHGCENNREHTSIYVKGWVSGKHTIFVVKDSGVGISKENLEDIRKSLSIADELEYHHTADNIQHLGLLNVQRRIMLRYGNYYGIKVESEEGQGTQVTIILPVLSEMEDSLHEKNYSRR